MKKVSILFLCFAMLAMNVVQARYEAPNKSISAVATITGVVVDSKTGEPLAGASVKVKNTSQITTTDASGKFSIAADANATLVINYVGYGEMEIELKNQTQVSVQLSKTVNDLDEVVVIGYGTQKKGDVTSAVASVKSENFTKGFIKDAAQLIQGKVAGLTISNTSGDPDANLQIQLRGITTLNGSTAPLVLIDGIPGNMNSVAPEDIESIDVLKDGSAAAIYGTRGTNGVILITTRKMRGDGRMTVDYSGSVGIQTIARKMPFLSAQDFRDYIKAGIGFTDQKTSTDWFDLITQTPVSQIHNITFQGGNRNTNYTASVNYRDMQGIFLTSGFKQLTTRVDINHSAVDGKVKFNLNAITRQQRDNSVFGSNIYRQALIRNPTDSVYNASGGWMERSIYMYTNPLGSLMESKSEGKEQESRFSGSVIVTPIKGLNLKGLFSTTRRFSTDASAQTKKHSSNTVSGRNGQASLSESNSLERLMELTADYNKSYGRHKITVLGGYSYLDNKNDAFSMSNFDFPTDVVSWNNIGMGSALTRNQASMSSSASSFKLISFFGRLTYNYNDKYMLMAAVRQEGSSKFGANNKWGTFPSLSVGWRIKKENFMQNVEFVNDLKLRVGYGLTGIAPNSSYQSLTSLSYSSSRYLDNGNWIQPLVPARNPNPNLKWERKEEYNFGLDFTLFKNKLSGTIDVYQRNTKDMLYNYSVPVPPYLYNNIQANVARMQNDGVEVLLNYSAVQKKDFEWTTSVNFSTNKNKLVSLSNDLFGATVTYFTAGGTGEPVQDFTHRVDVGGPLGNIYSFKSIDVDASGKWIIEGADGKPKSILDNKPEDKKVLGNGLPKWNGGWNNSIRYKNFNLGFMFRGSFGFQIINFQRMFYENPTVIGNYNVLKSAFDPVYGKTRLTSPQAFVSYYVENGDYVKLDNLNLSYNVPLKNRKYVKNLGLILSVQNVFTITGYKGVDPEVTRSATTAGTDERDKYPTTRAFTFGINASF